jgi:hypothetical protein
MLRHLICLSTILWGGLALDPDRTHHHERRLSGPPVEGRARIRLPSLAEIDASNSRSQHDQPEPVEPAWPFMALPQGSYSPRSGVSHKGSRRAEPCPCLLGEGPDVRARRGTGSPVPLKRGERRRSVAAATSGLSPRSRRPGSTRGWPPSRALRTRCPRDLAQPAAMCRPGSRPGRPSDARKSGGASPGLRSWG